MLRMLAGAVVSYLSKKQPTMESTSATHVAVDVVSDGKKKMMGCGSPSQWSFLVVMILGAVGAFDFTAASMSIQACYYLVQGPESVYGLVVGIYDVAQLLVAPFFGMWADRYGYKAPFAFGALCTLGGNLLYGLLFIIYKPQENDLGWPMMLVARVIMGMGSAVIVTGSALITKYTTFEERGAALGNYRVSQTLARMIGPFVGFIFVAMEPEPTTAKNLFNFYTMPSWIAVVLGVVAFLLVLFKFDESSLPLNKDTAQDTYSSKEAFGMLAHILGPMLLINLLWGTFYWSVNSQIFGFAVGTFHIVHEQTGIWKAFLGTAGGAVAGAILFKRLGKKLAAKKVVDIEKKWVYLGMLAGLGAFFAFISYDGQSVAPPEGQYYVATALLGLCPVWFFANFEIVFSKALTWKSDIVGSHVGLVMAIYGVFGAGGRFLGPFISGYVMTIGTHGSDAQNCDYRNLASATCEPLPNTTEVPAAEYCCIGQAKYCNEGCDLANSNAWVTSVLIIGFVVYLAIGVVFKKMVNYPQGIAH